jgi:hypothetical protein
MGRGPFGVLPVAQALDDFHWVVSTDPSGAFFIAQVNVPNGAVDKLATLSKLKR